MTTKKYETVLIEKQGRTERLAVVVQFGRALKILDSLVDSIFLLFDERDEDQVKRVLAASRARESQPSATAAVDSGSRDQSIENCRLVCSALAKAGLMTSWQ